MIYVDLSALTEAVQERLTIGGDYNPLDWSLSNVVRAVLEALPREWGWQVADGQEYGEVIWTGAEASARYVVEEIGGPRLVWRAVGPPIPADEPQDAS